MRHISLLCVQCENGRGVAREFRGSLHTGQSPDFSELRERELLQKVRHTDRQTYRHLAYGQTDRQTDTHTDRQADIQTDRQTDRRTDKQTDRQSPVALMSLDSGQTRL